MNVEQQLQIARSHFGSGRYADAEEVFRRIVQRVPTCAEAWHLWGVLAAQSGRGDEGVDMLRRSVQLDPTSSRYHSNLAGILGTLGHAAEALDAAREAVALDPGNADAHHNLGVALSLAGRSDQAVDCYRRAVDLRPDYIEAWNKLGVALTALGHPAEAADALCRAIALNGHYAPAYANLAVALRDLGQIDAAIAACRRGIELQADQPEPHHNLGRLLAEIGHVDEAIECYQAAIARGDARGVSGSSLLLALHNRPDADPRAIFEQHLRWSALHAEPLARHVRPHANDRDPDRPLRIGYVSPNFLRHSVAYFIEAALAHHDRGAFEVTAYADVPHGDDVTARLKTRVDRWVDVVGLTDEQAAARIRDDGIDVLIDLAGHTSGNRLLTFAVQPAPVQVTYLGYPDTSGLKTMQWRLTDERADPAGASDAFYTERLWRLRDTFLCYTPPPEAPAVAEPDRRRPITFACFNTFRKINRTTMQWWAKILHGAAGSRLVLKAHALTSEHARRETHETFARLGIGADRIELLEPASSTAEHLACYHATDIALDTFPYNGATTTCEALWMGVPLVSVRGRTHASRVGTSLLSAVGLSDLAVGDGDYYVGVAIKLAADRVRLAELRHHMRERMRRSPLLDGPAFTRELEQAYRSMWREWCASAPRPP